MTKQKSVMQDEEAYIIQNESRHFAEEDWEEYRKFLNGDISGFENLVYKHKDHLIYYLHHIVKDILLAEDFAQDAFVEIYVHKERYHFKTAFKTYLYTIGRNKAIDFIRKNQRLVYVDEYPEQPGEAFELEKRVIRKEEEKILHEAVKTLKKEYREAVVLVDFEGLSYAEAAKILKKTLPQVKILLYRARKSLSEKVKKAGLF